MLAGITAGPALALKAPTDFGQFPFDLSVSPAVLMCINVHTDIGDVKGNGENNTQKTSRDGMLLGRVAAEALP